MIGGNCRGAPGGGVDPFIRTAPCRPCPDNLRSVFSQALFFNFRCQIPLFRRLELPLQNVLWFYMTQVIPAHVVHSPFTENIINDGSCHFYVRTSVDQTAWFKLCEYKGIHKLLERHPVLQSQRYRDSKTVHKTSECCPLFVHIDKDFTELPVLIDRKSVV